MALGSNVPTPYASSSGTIYYVDKDTGSDSNNGLSLAQAWATVNKACQTVPANSIIKVKKATTVYSETFTLTRGGTQNNPITVQAYDTANPPTIQGKITLQGTGASYWWWRYIDFDGGTLSGNNNLMKLTGSGADRFASNVAPHHVGFYACTAHDALGSGAGWITTFNDVHEIQWWNCVSYSNDPLTTTHGWYFNGGSNLYCMNCIARDNGGYGFHIFTDGDQVPSNIRLYNCLSISQDGRAGYLIQYGSGDPDNNALVPYNNHFYNCIGAFNTQGGASDRYGYRVKSGTAISSWTGYGPKNTIESCLAFGNTDGASDIVTAQMVDVTNLIQGDPLFVNWPAFDYRLQSGTAARNEPATTKTNTFEGGSNGTTISAVNSGGASGSAFNTVTVGSGNTFTFANDSGKVTQTLGGKWTFGGTAVGSAVWTGLGSLTAKTWFRGTFVASALPTVGNWFGIFQTNVAAGTRCAAIALRTDGKIQVYDAAGVGSSSSVSSTRLSANTLYRLEFAITPGVGGTGIVEWWLYDSATAGAANFIEHNTTSGLTLGANIDQFQIGVDVTPANVSGISGWYDDLAISTVDQLGPRGGSSFTPNPAIATGIEANTPAIDFNGATRAAADIGPIAYTTSGGTITPPGEQVNLGPAYSNNQSLGAEANSAYMTQFNQIDFKNPKPRAGQLKGHK
jgi:hypothetical protein